MINEDKVIKICRELANEFDSSDIYHKRSINFALSILDEVLEGKWCDIYLKEMKHINNLKDGPRIKQIKFKNRTLNITMCDRCPMTRRDSIGYYCGEDGHYIYDMSVIPSWCPLEDEHE